MIKLAVSTVLSAVATPDDSSAAVIRLCGVALEAINAGLVTEWLGLKGSSQQMSRLRERGSTVADGEMFQAVMSVS